MLFRLHFLLYCIFVSYNQFLLFSCSLYYVACAFVICLIKYLLTYLLTCITQCAPIGIHGEMCSHWIALKNVLLSTCMQNVLLTAKFQSLASLLQQNILSLSYGTTSAFDFTSQQKVLLYYTANTCAPIDLNNRHLFSAVNNNSSTFHQLDTTSLPLFFDIRRTKQGKQTKFRYSATRNNHRFTSDTTSTHLPRLPNSQLLPLALRSVRLYTVSGKKGATLSFAITLPNLNRSSKLFYRHTQQ